jgi:hypothetical protein
LELEEHLKEGRDQRVGEGLGWVGGGCGETLGKVFLKYRLLNMFGVKPIRNHYVQALQNCMLVREQ